MNWLAIVVPLLVLVGLAVVLALPKPDGTPGIFWNLFK